MDSFDDSVGEADKFIHRKRFGEGIIDFVPIDYVALATATRNSISAGADPSSAADLVARRMRSLGNPADFSSFPIFTASPYSVDIGPDLHSDIPTYTDVWYIHVGITVLPPWSYATQGDWYINQDRSQKVKDLILNVLKASGNVSLLRCPRSAADVSGGSNSGIETVKEARYECMDGDRAFSWPSRGPDLSRASGVASADFNKNFCAYIAFPVGPIGPAVRTISLVVEKITQPMKDDDKWSSEAVEPVKGGRGVSGGLFPPPTSDNECYGLHLIENYAKRVVNSLEYPALDFVGLPRHKKHSWLRYYFNKTCKFLIPGQFIGITIKPETFHCWWYQETSPLLYSGAFFETRFYTSGKIIKVLKEDEKKHKEVGSVYVVRIRGTDIHIQSSDFLEYKVDDFVTVLKVAGVTAQSSSAFPWLDMDDLDHLLESLGDDPSKGVYTLVKDYVIVPFTFYEEQATASAQPASS